MPMFDVSHSVSTFEIQWDGDPNNFSVDSEFSSATPPFSLDEKSTTRCSRSSSRQTAE